MGPPFLMPGETIIDIAATNCRVRPQKAGSTGKLAYGKDFVWPLAPLTRGGTVDLTTVPANQASLDLAACQIDPNKENGYITAVRPDKHLIFGYVFRREEYPWVMSWMNYTGDARADAPQCILVLVVREAVRYATLGGRKVKSGQTIALGPDDVLIAANRDREKCVLEAVATLKPGFELITLFYGDGAGLAETEGMARRIGSTMPGIDVEVRHGGQPYYRYLISAE